MSDSNVGKSAAPSGSSAIASVLGGGLFLVFAVLCILWAIFGPTAYTIPSALIQEKIAERMDKDIPLKGTLSKFLKNLKPKAVTLEFKEGQLEVQASVEGVIDVPFFRDKPFAATLYGRGVPRLRGREVCVDAEEKSLQVRAITINGKPITENFEQLAEEYLNGGLKIFAKKNAGEAERLSRSFAEYIAERTLKRKCFEVLKGWKGTLAAWAVTEIKIHPEGVEIKFSLGTLLWEVMFWTVIVGVAIAVAVFLVINGFVLSF